MFFKLCILEGNEMLIFGTTCPYNINMFLKSCFVRGYFNNPVFKEINILKVTFSKKNGLKYKTSELGMALWLASLLSR